MKKIAAPHFGGPDTLCVEFIADAIKAVRVKALGPRHIVTDVSYKDVRGLGRPEIVTALREFLRASRKRGDIRVVLSIPSPLVITKNIEIPSQDPQEIKEIINLQAGRLTPYAREEVIIDYINIGVFRQSYTKLLLLIVNKDVVNKQLSLFAEAGVRIDHVLLPAEALGVLVYHHLKMEVQDTVYSIIHTDDTSTDFGVYIKGRLVFLRSIPVGAQHLLNEKDKHLARFIDELKKSLDAYQAEDIEASPSLVVFTGAIDGLRDMEVMMLDAFRIPVRLLGAPDFMPRSDTLPKENLAPRGISVLGAAAPALGMSSSVVNLIPDEVKLRLSLEERGRDIIKTGVLAMTIILFVCASFLVNIYLKAEYLKKLNEKFRTLNAEASEIESDFSKVRIIHRCLQNRGAGLNVLAELYVLTPLEIALSNIRLRETGDLSVKGEATSMSAVFTYLGNLEKSDTFKGVKTKYTSKKKVGDQEIVDFEISGVLEKTAEGGA